MRQSVSTMVKPEGWAKAGLLIAIIAALLPFWTLSWFNHPSGDNFCYTNVFNDHDIDGIIAGVNDWRRRWNGRYFSLFLMGSYFIPFDMISTYRYPPLLLFGTWCIAGYYLFRSFATTFQTRLFTIGLVLGLCSLYILTMPLVSNGFYHVTGAFQYQVGNILTLATLGCMLRISLEPKRWPNSLIGSVLIFFTIGCTELHMAQIVILVSAVTMYGYWTRSDARHNWSFLLLVALLSAALLIFAPGNEVRGQHFEARHQFWFSVSESLVQLHVWFERWVRQPLLWLMTLAYITFSYVNITQCTFFRKVTPAYLVIGMCCWLCSLFACFFISFWAMGVSLPGRALNVVYFIFLLGWFGVINIGLGLWNRNSPNSSAQMLRGQSGRIISILTTLALTVGLVRTESVQTAYKDLIQRAQTYDEIFKSRYDRIQTAADQSWPLVSVFDVSAHNRPNTIMVDDIRPDPSNFRNTCYATYFKIGGIRIIPNQVSWVNSAPVIINPVGRSELSDYAYYVLAYSDLTAAWSKTDYDLHEWGERHWMKHGQSEGRVLRPLLQTDQPSLALRHEPSILADRVSCGLNGAIPDTRPDVVFSLDVETPPDKIGLWEIAQIQLERAKPGHIYDTTNRQQFLGVSLGKTSPLLKNTYHTIHNSSSQPIQRLWLFACADGLEHPGSIYLARGRFQSIMN